MVRLFMLLVALAVPCFAQLDFSPQRGTMKNAEKMTAKELKQLSEAKAAVEKAQANLESVKAGIAKAHNMGTEHWMEWESWVEFDGEWIIQRFLSKMTNNIGW